MSIASRIRSGLADPSTLARRAATASLWSIGELGASYALRLISNLVMTHLLVPQAFGLMAMIITLHVALGLFTDIGIQQSIVRSPRGEETHFLRVAWVVQVMRSTVIGVGIALAGSALWVLAPRFAPAGTVYADPQLPGLVVVSALAMIVDGLQSNRIWLAVRRMRFGRTTILNLASQVFSMLAMIGFASIDATVWALLFGLIAGAAFKTVLSHVYLEGPTMGFAWDREITADLWAFGKWLIGSSAFTFFAANADRIILGGLLDARAFGLYVIAYSWIQAVSAIPQMLTSRIGFSAFSEVLHLRPEAMAQVYARFAMVIDTIAFGGFLLALLGGNLLIRSLYPSSYASAGAFMPILSIGVLGMRFATIGSFALAHGRSRAMMLSSGASAAAICVLLPLGYRIFGVSGAILAVAIAPSVGALTLMRAMSSEMGANLRSELLKSLAFFVVAAAVYIVFGF